VEVQLTLFFEDTLRSFRLVVRHLARHEDVQYYRYRPDIRLLRIVWTALPVSTHERRQS